MMTTGEKMIWAAAYNDEIKRTETHAAAAIRAWAAVEKARITARRPEEFEPECAPALAMLREMVGEDTTDPLTEVREHVNACPDISTVFGGLALLETWLDRLRELVGAKP